MAFLFYERDDSGQEVLVTFDATERDRHSTRANVSQFAVETGSNITDQVRAENDRVSLDIRISNTPFTIKGRDQANPDYSHMDGATFDTQNVPLVYPAGQPKQRAAPRLVTEGSPPLSLRDVAPGAEISAQLLGLSGLPGVVASVGAGIKVFPAITPVWQPGAETPKSPPQQEISVRQASKPFDRVRRVYEELTAMAKRGQICTVVTSLREYESVVLENVETLRETSGMIECSLEIVQIRVVSSQTVEVTLPAEPRGQKQREGGKQKTAPLPESENQSQRNASWAAQLSGWGF